VQLEFKESTAQNSSICGILCTLPVCIRSR